MLSNQKWPVTGAMLANIIAKNWEDNLSKVTVQAFEELAGALMGMMVTELWVRISNLAQVESKVAQRAIIDKRLSAGEFSAIMSAGGELLDRHQLRAKDVAVLIETGWVSAFVFSRGLAEVEQVQAVGIVFWTSKTNQGGDRIVSYVVSKQSWGQERLVEMMAKWARFAQYDHGRDAFMSRPSIQRLQGGSIRSSKQAGS